MDGHDNLISELSPLDQIRHAEADVIRQRAAARETADCKVKVAQRDRKVMIDKARESGKRFGLTRYKEILSIAENEAQTIISQAHHQAKHLRHRG